MRFRRRSRRLLRPVLLERRSSLPCRNSASRHLLRCQFLPNCIVHHFRVPGEPAVSPLSALRASQERIPLWAFTRTASTSSVSHHGGAARLSKHAQQKDLTKRCSQPLAITVPRFL